jgi:hypothetical protein
LENKNYRDELESLLIEGFVPAGYKVTKNVELDPVPESSKYEGLIFGLNHKNIVYRKGNVTSDRPGAFLAVWQRPVSGGLHDNKPIPLTSNELDYLFIQVERHVSANEKLEHSLKHGMFIFPASLLIEKGILCSVKNKGKTGFRVFPPWSQDRGVVGTKVFSESGKKTQKWQLPYFIPLNADGLMDPVALNKILNH